MQMDGPLEEIVAGTFDHEAAADAAREMATARDRLREIAALVQANEHGKALDRLDARLVEAKAPERRQRLTAIRLQIAIRAGGEQALQAFAAAAKEAGDSAEALNELARSVVQAVEAQAAISDDLVATALAI